jgi:hypothetical protein
MMLIRDYEHLKRVYPKLNGGDHDVECELL